MIARKFTLPTRIPTTPSPLRPVPTSRRLEAGATGGTSPSRSLSTPGEGRGAVRTRPPLLWARSCGLRALMPPELYHLLKEEIGKKLARHFEAPQWEYPIWLSRDSEPLWDGQAHMLCAGRALRGLSLERLHELLLFEMERRARYVVERHPERTLAERAMGVRATLRRIGQIFRELRWRYGERRALYHIRLVLSALHWW